MFKAKIEWGGAYFMYVKVENVSFAYDEGMVLHNVSFEFNKGEIDG